LTPIYQLGALRPRRRELTSFHVESFQPSKDLVVRDDALCLVLYLKSRLGVTLMVGLGVPYS
jgi:hypothetical protein